MVNETVSTSSYNVKSKYIVINLTGENITIKRKNSICCKLTDVNGIFMVPVILLYSMEWAILDISSQTKYKLKNVIPSNVANLYSQTSL